MGYGFDISGFLLLFALSLLAGGVGFLAFLAGLQAVLRLAGRHRWLAGWSRLLRALPTTVHGLRRGDVVCLEGVCGKPLHGQMLVSPIFRTSCVAYWVEVRGGVLSRVTHRQSCALPFELEQPGGEPSVVIDPRGADSVEFPGRGEHLVADSSILDGELARHLEACAVRLGSAEPLGITQGRLASGKPCTVIGQVERLAHHPAPYRQPEGPAVVGGRGTLLLASASRKQLESQLWWQRVGVCLRALAAVVAMGGALFLMVGAALLQPLMFPVMVMAGVPITARFVEHHARGAFQVALWSALSPVAPPGRSGHSQ